MKIVSKFWALELKDKPNTITASPDNGHIRIYESRRQARENKKSFEKIVPVEVFDAK